MYAPVSATLLLIEHMSGDGTITRIEKKKYAPPKLNELASDKANAFLLDHEAQGNEEAKELLSLLKQASA